MLCSKCASTALQHKTLLLSQPFSAMCNRCLQASRKAATIDQGSCGTLSLPDCPTDQSVELCGSSELKGGLREAPGWRGHDELCVEAIVDERNKLSSDAKTAARWPPSSLSRLNKFGQLVFFFLRRIVTAPTRPAPSTESVRGSGIVPPRTPTFPPTKFQLIDFIAVLAETAAIVVHKVPTARREDRASIGVKHGRSTIN